MPTPGSRYRRPVTAEQRAKADQAREEKLTGLHRQLTDQVTALATGPEWRRWLEVAAKFHTYSFNNTLLILAQRPEATQVAGYTLWQSLGRQVGKGERGIAILAPVTRRPDPDEQTTDTGRADAPDPVVGQDDPAIDKQPGEPGDAAGDAARRRVVGFRPAYVWDISQTSGEPVPEPPRPRLLAGQAPPGLWDALAAQCTAAGFTVTRAEIAGNDGPNGYTDFHTRQVVVRADVDDAQAVKTLAHELAHALMHSPDDFPGPRTAGCRGEREVEAESVAYLVAADHGLDTSGYSFAYLAGWAASTGDVPAALRNTGARVLATAHQVLQTAGTGLAHPTATPADAQVAASSVVQAEQLGARAAAGADRTATLRAAVDQPTGSVPRERLVAANAAAAAFFTEQLAGSWAPGYLTARLGVPVADLPAGRVGYAPAGWTALTEHLRGQGFSDVELLEAGLATRARTGRLVDRFRDRLIFPITTTAGTTADGGDQQIEILGFVGRRNPALDQQPDRAAAGYQAPKYLNTATTALYVKGEQLYGLAEHRDLLTRGGLAVLVEGPLDALAVDLASHGAMTGLAPLGTSLTATQAGQLAQILGPGSDRVVVATDPDPAGRQAAARAYPLLTAAGLDPRGAALPAGLDPADTAQTHGPAALVDLIATAPPLGRQLIDHALTGREVRWDWPEHRAAAAALAAGIITSAPPATWAREVDAAAEQTGLPLDLLYTAVMQHIGAPPETENPAADAWGRLAGRDRRDDLHRGQHIAASPAQLAATSRPHTGPLRPAGPAAPSPPRSAQPPAAHPLARQPARHH